MSGISYFGQSLQRLGARIKDMDLSVFGRENETVEDVVDAQELLRAQRLFNTEYNNWLAANAGTPWNRMEDAYEGFANEFRNRYVGGDNELFTGQATHAAFSSWLDESISAQRVPLAQTAAQKRSEYRQALFEDNLKAAVASGDADALQTTLAAAVRQGDLDEMYYDDMLSDGLYQMNINQVRSFIFDVAQAQGWNAAEQALSSLPDEAFTFTVGYDDAGNPVTRTLSYDDIKKVRDEVWDQIQEARKEAQYRVDRMNTAADEQANQIFRDNSMGDLLAFKSWLDGTNPTNGQQLPEDQNPRSTMKADTWLKWNRLVTGLIDGYEREAEEARTAEEEEAAADRRRELLTQLLQTSEDDPDKEVPITLILQGVEEGVLDEDDARTWINYADSRNENPVYDALVGHLDALAKQYQVPPAMAGRVKEAWLNYWNEDARQRNDGETVFNLDRASSEQMQRVAENIFMSMAGDYVKSQARAAYQIQGDLIQPAQNSTFRSMAGLPTQNDPNWVDPAEQLLAAIQRDEYAGYEAMPQEIKNQLNTLWHGQEAMFTQMTGVMSVKTELFSGSGQPTFVAPDNTFKPRMFRFVIPKEAFDQDGQLRDRGLFGGRYNEQLQVWDGESGRWYDVEVGAFNIRGNYVNFSIIPGREGWTK